MTDLTQFDLCQCFDYRRVHVGGTGKCRLPDTYAHDFQPCLEFRLWKTAESLPEEFKEQPGFLEDALDGLMDSAEGRVVDAPELDL